MTASRVSTARRAPAVALLQVVIPDYRTRFFELLQEELGSDLEILAGRDDFERTVRPADSFSGWTEVRNRFVAGRRLLWQSGALRTLLRAHVAVLSLNPRILNVWAALVLRRVLRRRTILWGHAWPRTGAGSATDRLRHLMRVLADGLIVYTETEANELRGRMGRVEIAAAPNALFLATELDTTSSAHRAKNVVFVGRLIAAKKPDLLLRAFLLALDDLPPDANLIFVGDGPLRPSLEAQAVAAGATERVVFEGHVTDLSELRRIYGEAVISVSPGYSGLNLIQSLGFGVPALIARGEPHAPEIEAAVEGENAVFFESDSPTQLAALLVTVFGECDSWHSRRAAIAADCARTYTVEAMAARFLDILHV
jgi:glycosyltransferase involved in cell wall biosynthesis